MEWRRDPKAAEAYMVVAPEYRIFIYRMAVGMRYRPVRLHPLAMRYQRVKPLKEGQWIPPENLAGCQVRPEEAKRIAEAHYQARQQATKGAKPCAPSSS